MTGHPDDLPIGLPVALASERVPLSDLHIGELSRDAGRHVGATDLNPGLQALLLIPPAAPLDGREKPQMLSVSEDAHGELPNRTADKKQRTQLQLKTETIKTIVRKI
ncbi:hypothetical protein [Paraburkholderia sp. J12]|uniref:hypothetical protein n=1 Tax=Paraburkholderia sp. J12 TaxID=2805432 RepID=UPI002ABD2282|nr:hypothetical protein [Paraburkholderia sp. J12]